MSFPDESLPLDDTADDELVEIVDADDDPETSNADEEMSGELDGEDSDDDDESALEDDLEEDDLDADEDPEKADLRRQVAEYDAEKRRFAAEAEQRRNQEYWDNLQSQADAAFEWEFDQIQSEKHNYVDPDAYERVEVGKWRARVNDWHQRFYASQNETRRQAYERAAVPTYAARIATHFALSPKQSQELLDYEPKLMAREAQKMARINARETKLREQLKQAKRKDARDGLIANGTPTGGGRGRINRVKRGSEQHLALLLSGAVSA